MLIISQFVISLIGTGAILAFEGGGAAASWAVGAGVVAINLFLHNLVWRYLIVRKNLIAFAVSVIVFKYAIFGVIIFKTLSAPWSSALWFGFGVGTLVLSSLTVALKKERYVV